MTPSDTSYNLGKPDYQKCDWCGHGANLANQRLGKMMWFRPDYFINQYWVHKSCKMKSIEATQPYIPEEGN